jgi:hypothetical protein
MSRGKAGRDKNRKSGGGTTKNLTKALVPIAHGGQILTTSETWEIAASNIGFIVDMPQVVDQGWHVIPKGKTTKNILIAKRLIQLVPSYLAYDFYSGRKSGEGEHNNNLLSTHVGRQFPPPISLKRLSPSFHDAPFEDNTVTIAFATQSVADDRRGSFLSNLVESLLDSLPEVGGYFCGGDMLVFKNPIDAVLFGLQLRNQLQKRESHAEGTSRSIKYACINGSFLTMGPHKTTGRAFYEGDIVRLAQSLSNTCSLGSVNLGVVSGNDRHFANLSHSSAKACFSGLRSLADVGVDVLVYECTSKTAAEMKGTTACEQIYDQ